MIEAIVTALFKAPWKHVVSAVKWARRRFLYRKKLGHFISPEQYYQRFLGKRSKAASITHEFDCVGRGDELDNILDALDSAKYSVIHVTAPPGYGKSRFSLELAKLMRGEGRGVLWYFRRMGIGGIWKVYFPRRDSTDLLEYVDELRKRSNVAIIVDDAHRSVDQVRALANYAGLTRAEGEMQLICFSRSTMSNLTFDALAEIPPEEIGEFALRKLRKDEIGEMIETYLPNISDSTKQQIVRFTQDSAFLTAMVCQLAKRGVEFSDVLTEKQFRRLICDAPLEEAVQPCGISNYAAVRTAAILAAATPANYQDSHIRTIARDLAGITETEYDCVIQSVCRAALFEMFSNNLIRPTPDLIGALLLDNACINDNGDLNEFANELLTRLLPHYPKQALNNLTDIGWTTRSETALDAVGPHLERIKVEAKKASPQTARDTIELLEGLAVRRSKDVVDYLELLLSRADDAEFSDDASRDDWRRVFGQIVPMLIAAARDRQELERSMELAFKLAENDSVSTPYSNHEPTYALSEILGFSLNKHVDCTLDALAVAETWFSQGGRRAIVALNSVHGLLSPVVQWTDSDTFTVSFRTAAINPSEKVLEARSRALGLILKGLRHDEREVQLAAFEALDSVGRYHGGAGHDPDSKVGKLVEHEKIQALDTLDAMVDAGLSLDVQLLVEKRLWDWWRIGSDEIAERAEVVLRKVDDSPKHRLCRLLFAGELPVTTMEDMLDSSDDVSRSDRYFSQRREERESSEEFITQLLGEIGLEDDPGAWSAYLSDVLTSGPQLSWRANSIFYYIGRQYVAASWALIKCIAGEPWLCFRANMLSGLRDSDKKRWLSELDQTNALPSVSSDVAIDWLSAMPWREPLGDVEWSFITKSAGHTDAPVQVILSNFLAHSGPDDWLRKREILLLLARQNLSSEKVIDNLFSALVHDRPADLKSSLHSLDVESLQLLFEEKLDSHIPWDKPYWIGEFLAHVALIEPERFFDFVKKSVSKFDQFDDMHVRILGARNADKAFKVLIEGVNRKSHLRKIIEWAATDNSLGVLAGAVLAKGIELHDPDIQHCLEVFYAGGQHEEIARVLQYFKITEPWFEEVRRLLRETDQLGTASFDRVSGLISRSYYVGTTSRTPGYGTPRDVMCVETFGRYLADTSLSARVRNFFSDHKKMAEESIERDIASDEALAGRRLDSPD